MLSPLKQPDAKNKAESFLIDSDWGLALVWAANAILSILIKTSATAATAHAVLITLFALWVTIAGRRSEYVAYVCAFIVGSEVLWRMSHASVFYEISKYSVALCCMVAVARMKRKHIPIPALTYILLLAPAALITVVIYGFVPRLPKQLSFNLSGPLALAAAMCFFSNVRLSQKQLWRVMILLVTPIIGIGAITVFATHTAAEEDLVFSTESNRVTSGGFGPNQVSSALGLGAALLLLYLAQQDMSMRRKLIISGGLLLCIVQSALTFSRSGLYAAFGACGIALVFLLRDPRIRSRLAYLGVIGGIVGVFGIFPYLVMFTDGAITKRFSSTKLTGREEIVMTDIEIFKQQPVYGIGVGNSSWYHYKGLASHNEMSRLLAEHGLFGIAAILTLFGYGLHRLMLARSPIERAFIAVMFGWPILFMLVNGFRVAAPAFILGLGCMTFREPDAIRQMQMPRRISHTYAMERTTP
jgi:hypothetical protein